MFTGFIERFGHSDCRTLTGCDWSVQADIERYMAEEIYKDKCFVYFKHVLEYCMEQAAAMTAGHDGS